jgi:hypothetical protein
MLPKEAAANISDRLAVKKALVRFVRVSDLLASYLIFEGRNRTVSILLTNIFSYLFLSLFCRKYTQKPFWFMSAYFSTSDVYLCKCFYFYTVYQPIVLLMFTYLQMIIVSLVRKSAPGCLWRASPYEKT